MMMVRGDGLTMSPGAFEFGSSMGVETVEVAGVVDHLGAPTIWCERVLR